MKLSYNILLFFTALLFITLSCEKDPDPTCFDNMQNGLETGVDCGGPVCVLCITCSDGLQNGNETGVDCGGADCPACFSCTDGIMNGQETGIDCGGPDCPACTTCSDGIQNGNETGIDCGGLDCPACPSCTDGIMNGQETGIDCGGPDCPACPSCDDGIQNGSETGIDCGGSDCLPCYDIGSAGPGNGVVFYDKENYNDGWRYMETAADIQGTNETWGCDNQLINGTSLALGSGLSNTEAIMGYHNANSCGKIPEAALECSNFNSGGLNDWFLPSVNELKEMYLVKSQLGITNARYWSSTESNAEDAYVVDFSASSVDDSSYTYYKIPTQGQQGNARIKPVRRF